MPQLHLEVPRPEAPRPRRHGAAGGPFSARGDDVEGHDVPRRVGEGGAVLLELLAALLVDVAEEVEARPAGAHALPESRPHSHAVMRDELEKLAFRAIVHHFSSFFHATKA